MDDFSTKNKYIELLELFSLKQCVKIPTRITGTSKTVIDHVITNIENKSELCTRVLEQGVSDHQAILTSYCNAIKVDIHEPKISVSRTFLNLHKTSEKINNMVARKGLRSRSTDLPITGGLAYLVSSTMKIFGNFGSKHLSLL